MTSQSRGRSFLLAASILSAAPALAHHGIGRFDPRAELTVEGTLTGLDFVNPHSYVHFDAVGADGATIAMQCEMRAATVLRRSGWSPDMFVPGVRIKIVGRPHRDDPHYCYADTLSIGDAPAIERYQQLRDGAPAEPANRPYRLASGRPNLAGDWAQEQYIMARPPEGAPTPGVAPSRAGHSIGRWDGDTLVVDSVAFEPGSLAGAVPHGADLHIVERFTLDPETLELRRDYVATDPLHFVGNYVGGDTVLPADAPFAVDACKELAFEYQPGNSR